MSKKSATDINAHYYFNKIQYNSEDRQFLCASLVRYIDHGGMIVLELWAGDSLSPLRVCACAKELQRIIAPEVGELCFRAMSSVQEKTLSGSMKDAGIRVVTASELFGKVCVEKARNSSPAGGRISSILIVHWPLTFRRHYAFSKEIKKILSSLASLFSFLLPCVAQVSAPHSRLCCWSSTISPTRTGRVYVDRE